MTYEEPKVDVIVFEEGEIVTGLVTGPSGDDEGTNFSIDGNF